MKRIALLIMVAITMMATALAHTGRSSSMAQGMENLIVADDGTLILSQPSHLDTRPYGPMLEDENGQIFALQEDGQTRWVFSFDRIGEDLRMLGNPLTADSFIFIALSERHTHSLRIRAGSNHDGNRSQDSKTHLVALDLASGEVVWQLEFQSFTPTTPTLDPERKRLYIWSTSTSAEDDHGDHMGGGIRDEGHNPPLIAIDFNGQTVWERTQFEN